MNCIHLIIPLLYSVPKIGERSSNILSSLSPKLSFERTLYSASADWNYLILKLSSSYLRCCSIYVSICVLNNWACQMFCTGWNGCHRFQYSVYLQCVLYNPVGLPYIVHPAFSTPTTWLWAIVSIVSGVHVRSCICASTDTLSRVSSGGAAPPTLLTGRWVVDQQIDGRAGVPTNVEP